jgi:alkanesulfonate monooxygenase SsuD/methylene tetrahydromethanopterin reductase-like flavin-dependent oxidoreductase (luciferase family)
MIDLGTMVLVLPWHEPLKLAGNIALLGVLLGVLLGGRKLNIGVGRGFAVREFNALRIPYAESRGRMQECLDIVRTALTQEFSYEGEYFSIPRTTIRPRPQTTDLTRDLLMTWASAESLKMAAHNGAAPLFTNYRGWDALATTYAPPAQPRNEVSAARAEAVAARRPGSSPPASRCPSAPRSG